VKVEVLYFEGCPNHPPAVERVRSVLREEGLPEEVLEIDVKAAEAGKTTGFLGSPTILVNGKDIDPAVRTFQPAGFSCRTYVGGLPSEEMIRAALREAKTGQ
jgi:hypothetical protein